MDPLSFQDTIAAAEAAASALSNADTALAQANAKLAADTAASVATSQADADAVTANNAAMDALSVAALAQKR